MELRSVFDLVAESSSFHYVVQSAIYRYNLLAVLTSETPTLGCQGDKLAESLTIL